MFYYIVSISITGAIMLFLNNIDMYNIVYNTISRKYKKWKKINNLVSSQHKSLINIYKISLEMIFQALWLSFIQYLNKTIIKLDKNIFQISYIIKGKKYNMIVIPNKHPTKILQILDENNDDLTDNILPFYGPNYDWYNIKFIPQFFKCKKLIFILDDGSEHEFKEHDYISKFD